MIVNCFADSLERVCSIFFQYIADGNVTVTVTVTVMDPEKGSTNEGILKSL